MPRAPKVVPLKPRAAAPKRGTTTERGYGWAHQRLRARLMQLHPLCQRCGTDWSRHLHHRNRDPHDRRPSNVEMLCQRCHAAEHAGG
jgi:5-methylcytosine-specific restriction endonuclease McrA